MANYSKKYELFIDITYNAKKDKSRINTNVKRDKVRDILCDFLAMQVGQGVDESKAKIRSDYHIQVKLDLSQDDFYVSDDTGNLGLRDGIILHTIGQLEGKV